MSKKRLKVSILWHMHQPDYRDPLSGRTLLPWTWLHALKDYGEMLETAAACEAPVTINLVPTLLEQLDRYRRNEAADSWLELAQRPAEELERNERIFVLEHFFSVNEQRHLLPYMRFRQLREKRGPQPATTVDNFSTQELRDLQVFFILSWTGYHLRQREPFLNLLLKRGENFSETDKLQLFALCHAEVARIIPRHAELEAAGKIEISLTPYAHPILPLLCDLQQARKPSPELSLPLTDFKQPNDARLQVREAQRVAELLLGKRGRGYWPAEGAVSEEAIRLLAAEGATWAASDEGILQRSLGAGAHDRLYRVYSYAGLPLIFRDREISDRIGFLYADWNATDAVNDIMARLLGIAERCQNNAAVAIILDGENCWERYPDNGYPFLSHLYQSLLAHPDLELCTIGQTVATSQPQPLENLAAGSWIRSDFTTWIGHPEENRAWELLTSARQDCFKQQIDLLLETPDAIPDEQVRELLRAEGSDWFWWFGDEHQTTQAAIFDQLFRSHLEGMYHLGQRVAPDNLRHAIKPRHRQILAREPQELFTPHINGKRGDYFDWLAAGEIDLSAAGAMQTAVQGLQKLYYGYDEKNLYLRIDEVALLRSLCGDDGQFQICLYAQQILFLNWQPAKDTLEVYLQNKRLGRGQVVADEILEMSVRLKLLKLQPGAELRVFCRCEKNQRPNGRWPAEGDAPLFYRGAALMAENWLI